MKKIINVGGFLFAVCLLLPGILFATEVVTQKESKVQAEQEIKKPVVAPASKGLPDASTIKDLAEKQ